MAGFFNAGLRARVRAQQARRHARALGASAAQTSLGSMMPPSGSTHSERKNVQRPIVGPNRGRGGK
jgi:hypothetical protein